MPSQPPKKLIHFVASKDFFQQAKNQLFASIRFRHINLSDESISGDYSRTIFLPEMHVLQNHNEH